MSRYHHIYFTSLLCMSPCFLFFTPPTYHWLSYLSARLPEVPKADGDHHGCCDGRKINISILSQSDSRVGVNSHFHCTKTLSNYTFKSPPLNWQVKKVGARREIEQISENDYYIVCCILKLLLCLVLGRRLVQSAMKYDELGILLNQIHILEKFCIRYDEKK